jgi:hypothetical protein
MNENESHDLDLAALITDNVTRSEEDDLLASLIGDVSPSGTPPNETTAPSGLPIDVASPVLPAPISALVYTESPLQIPTSASRMTVQPKKRSGYAWEDARHVLPEAVLPLIERYPAIGLCQHSDFGLVVLAAYLEDSARKIRRNLKLGEHMFFHAPELSVFERDLKEFNCRVVVKTIVHQPGMVIRFWENTKDGDLPDRGSFVVRANGFERVPGVR